MLGLMLSTILHFSYEHSDQTITPLYKNVLMGIQEQPKSQSVIGTGYPGQMVAIAKGVLGGVKCMLFPYS